jgi:hypothetical protein
MSIAQRHNDCHFAFQKLCKVAQLKGSIQYRNLLDEFDKYSLWAGNIGATHSGKTYKLSLDYRLREASLYKEQVPHPFPLGAEGVMRFAMNTISSLFETDEVRYLVTVVFENPM